VTLQRLANHVAAFLFSALAPSLLAAALAVSLRLLPISFTIALGHALGLGLPFFAIFKVRHWINIFSCIGCGFVIGALPVGVFTWPLAYWSAGGHASIDGIATVVDGVPTAAGWFYYAQSVGFFGLFGALAGLAFWAVLRLTGELSAPVRAVNGAAEVRLHRSGPYITLAVSIAAVLLSSLVLAVPVITKDRTCHNMFRDGRKSVHSQVNMELEIGLADWPKLTTVFEDFGTTHSLSFRNSSRVNPGVVDVLGLSLCSERGANIEAHRQEWAAATFKALPLARSGVAIGVYELRSKSGWETLAQGLVAELESTWQGKVRFKDGSGRVMPMPEKLRRPN
jgi:hypothetical protein